jgi:phosphodiesterase/alkaline phosphatase D-like protein
METKNKKILLIIAFVLAFAIGISIFLFQDITDDSVQSLKPGTETPRSITTTATPQNTKTTRTTPSPAPGTFGSPILGSPTDRSITINILSKKGMEVMVEYGRNPGNYESKSIPGKSSQGEPVLITLENLQSGTLYYYRIIYRFDDETIYTGGTEGSFFTQRPPGATFSFGVQGDSHPERTGKMFNPELYLLTMQNAARVRPDFYFTMGDDFSIEGLIDRKQLSQESVNQVYVEQRRYLGIVGASSPLFLVNGNHEQAAKYLLDGTTSNPAVYAANARNTFYPLPVPGNFYSGDTEKVNNIGYLRDYYAFTWGDALFMVIDLYWHSNIPVDNAAGEESDKGTKKNKDLWDVTLGETQYNWFKKTLEESKAKYKFVFTHHVLGTGRGGIEEAKLYEWGGYNQQGVREFEKKRPGWAMPIHDLMVKNRVTIFFQGHDHIFARQELDGVIYQSVPNPADDTYTAFNRDAYKSGDVLPNSGFLNVTVSSQGVQIDYVRSYLSGDENINNKNGQVAFSYKVK